MSRRIPMGLMLAAAASLALCACSAGGGGTKLSPGQGDDAGPEAEPYDAPVNDTPIINTDTGQPDTTETCDADLQNSPSNCGGCGVVCSFDGAYPKCVEGACHIDQCADGFLDIDKNEANGCEYACSKTNGSVEICDNIDNDCNGVVDNGFNIQTDPQNCGACGVVCSAVNATSSCSGGKCGYSCDTGYSDLGNTSGGGCYYECPVMPKKAEECNGLDDDCDGTVDNGAPGADQDCHTNCPGNNCKGECQPGKTQCTGTASGLICVGGIKPSAEFCDGKDNDCDGVVDNGFAFQTDPLNCGSCGNNCGVGGTCVAGKCILACQTGFIDLNKIAADGCEYQCPVFPIAAETCNSKDDDCNGLVDDSPGGLGQPCDANCPAKAACVATNTCTATLSTCNGKCCGTCTMGAMTCINGAPFCQGGGGPQLEVCDGKDNNCDGQIDEGYDFQTDTLNCGGCGKACALANANNKCVAGQCAVAGCKSGFANLNNNAADGCEYTCPVNPPTMESCNGKDDDCNGLVDDNLATQPNFCTQTSICAGSKPICSGTLGWVCNYKQTNANIEVDATGKLAAAESLCDGVDGNCNTQIDESFTQLGKDCSVGNGACRGKGTFQCSADKKGVSCPAQADATKAVDELCNGVDDNCDGQIDERVPTGSLQCYNGTQHACLGWKDLMVKSGAIYIYQYEASRPDATTADGGSATSRSCSLASRMPWTNVSETAAAAACAAVKDSTNKAMRLCTLAEWQSTCTVGSTVNPIWAYDVAPTTYNGATCNGFDKLLGAPWATGSGAGCHANQAAGSVFDLSGNVAEWTSTATTVGGVTYYQIMGGSYSTLATGLNCRFEFVNQQASYAYYDLGFRCCADNAP
jgi:hypothetical protein